MVLNIITMLSILRPLHISVVILFAIKIPCAGQNFSPFEAQPNPVAFNDYQEAGFTLRLLEGEINAKVDSLRFYYSDSAFTLRANYQGFLDGEEALSGKYLCVFRDNCSYSGSDIREADFSMLDSMAVQVASFCGLCKDGSSSQGFSDTLFIYTEGTVPLKVALQDVAIPTSIEFPTGEKLMSVEIFPNPSNGPITLQLYDRRADLKLDVSIYNILGQEVYSSRVDHSSGSRLDFKIPDARLTPGLYVVKISEIGSGGVVAVAYSSLLRK